MAQGLLILFGYAAVIVAAWPWGLLAAGAHLLVLLATVNRRR